MPLGCVYGLAKGLPWAYGRACAVQHSSLSVSSREGRNVSWAEAGIVSFLPVPSPSPEFDSFLPVFVVEENTLADATDHECDRTKEVRDRRGALFVRSHKAGKWAEVQQCQTWHELENLSAFATFSLTAGSSPSTLIPTIMEDAL
jgi:hypothetical protein